MFLEGLISTAWQSWAHFCRDVVIDSCLGSTTSAGVSFAGCVTPLSWERVSYLAMQASNKSTPKVGLTNSEFRKEPTWGDVQKLQLIVAALNPHNQNTLISSFSASTFIKHVHIVRNAAAHRDRQTFGEVLRLVPFYAAYPLRHPVESTLWLDGNQQQPAFLFWLDEMRLVGELAIK